MSNKFDIENDTFLIIEDNRVKEVKLEKEKEFPEIHHRGWDLNGTPIWIHDKEHKSVKPIIREILADENDERRGSISLFFMISWILVILFIAWFVYDLFKEKPLIWNQVVATVHPVWQPVIKTEDIKPSPMITEGTEIKATPVEVKNIDPIKTELTEEHYWLINNNLITRYEGELQTKQIQYDRLSKIYDDLKIDFETCKTSLTEKETQLTTIKDEKLTYNEFNLFLGNKIREACENPLKNTQIKATCDKLYLDFLKK